MPGWPKAFTREAAREIVSQFVWSYWPYWGAPLMSAILGFVGGYSLLIIFMSAIAAFTFVALGLNQFSQWLAQQMTIEKVHFSAPFAGVTLHNENNPAELRGIKLGVILKTTANFPLEVRIDKLETKILDRIPSEDFYIRSVTAAPRGNVLFNNSMIDLSDIERANKLVYGRIYAVVSYGRKGNLRHQTERQWHLAIKFDENGALRTIEPNLNEFNNEVIRRLPNS
jgi:hypothetical protein